MFKLLKLYLFSGFRKNHTQYNNNYNQVKYNFETKCCLSSNPKKKKSTERTLMNKLIIY